MGYVITTYKSQLRQIYYFNQKNTIMVNKVILVGNVGNDPETTSFDSGSAVTKFSLATSYKTKDGDHTDWHSISCWGKTL